MIRFLTWLLFRDCDGCLGLRPRLRRGCAQCAADMERRDEERALVEQMLKARLGR